MHRSLLNRRNALKKLGSALGAATVLGGSIPTVTADEKQRGIEAIEEHSWIETENHSHSRFFSLTYDDYYTVSSTLRNHGGAVGSRDSTWEFAFDLESYAACRRYEPDKDPDTGFKKDRIGYQWLEVRDNGNADAYITPAPAKSGGTPAEGVTALEIAEATFEVVAEDTVSDLSKRVSQVLLVKDIWENIQSEWAEKNDYTDGIEFKWTYADGWAGPSHSDVNQFTRWDYEMENANDTTLHFARSEIAPDGKGFVDSIEWVIECNSPDSWSSNVVSGSLNTTDSTGHPAANFDPAYKEEVGLHPVPVDVLSEHGFDPERLLRVPGEPNLAWWASDLNINATAHTQTKSER